jgi:1,4-alpha-glucan branching enzyme
LLQTPEHSQFLAFMQALGSLYCRTSALWSNDHAGNEFSWIGVDDRANSVFSYLRRGANSEAVVVLNMMPEPRGNYRVGVPRGGTYEVLMNSDERGFGGSGHNVNMRVHTNAEPLHGFDQSLLLELPPLGALVLAHSRDGG